MHRQARPLLVSLLGLDGARQRANDLVDQQYTEASRTLIQSGRGHLRKPGRALRYLARQLGRNTPEGSILTDKPNRCWTRIHLPATSKRFFGQ